MDRLFRSPRVPAPPVAITCSHVTTPRAASSARARHSRASMWLSGCNARCRSPPFEDAWAVLAATLGDSDSALGCRDQSGTHGSDGEAPRPISHRAYQCECSRQVRGLLQPARPARPHRAPSVRASRVPSLSARSPARPSAVGARTASGCRQGCGGLRGAEALASVAMLCRGVPTMHRRLEEHLLKRGMPQRALLGTTRSASLSLESKKVPVALQSAVLCRGVEATTHSRARASPNPPSPYCMQCTS